MKSAVEYIKTVLLCVLAVAMVCLTVVYIFGFGNASSPDFTENDLYRLQLKQSKSPYTGRFSEKYIDPYFVGIRCGEKKRGLFSGTEKLYAALSEYLPGLIGAEGNMIRLSEENGKSIMRDVILGDYIYIKYRAELPRSIIYYMTFPDRMAENVSDEYIRELLIYPTGSAIPLLDEDGKTVDIYSYAALAKNDAGEYFIYTCEGTPSSFDDLYINKKRLSSYDITGGVRFDFAYELENTASLYETAVIADSIPIEKASLDVIPSDDVLDATLVGAFSLNYEKAAVFVDFDGGKTYFEEGQNVRIGVDGKVTYTVTGDVGGVKMSDLGCGLDSGFSVYDYVGCSLLLLSRTDIAFGDAYPVITGVFRSGDSVAVTFGLSLGGIPVSLYGTTDLIRFEFSHGKLVKADMTLISATLSGDYSTVYQNWVRTVYLSTDKKNFDVVPVYFADSQGKATDAEWSVIDRDAKEAGR